MIGQTIAHYRVTAKLGAGGMGEVYRATDAKLGREVALKVLPQAFASDPQRMQRFQREAQVLASLNHPHIAAIHGIEEGNVGASFSSPGASVQSGPAEAGPYRVHALAMELVEGPTLAERIGGGAMPLEEALPIAKQIAEALEYAHERGIIHRDLKPANIKLTQEGQVKVLDFGLAKALADDPASGSDLSNSPTLSVAATRAGIILGTAAYMPPEQAKGKQVDRRADIWSFGCVLFEMLSGKRAYAGEDVTETLAAVIRGEPEWGALPASTPPFLRTLLRRCLERDVKRRLQAIGEARVAMEDYLANPAAAQAGAATASQASAGLARPSRVAWAIAAVATVAAAALGVAYFRRPAEEPSMVRAFIPMPPQTAPAFVNSPWAGPPAVSPDGRFVVFATTHIGTESLQSRENLQSQMLWLRAMDSPTAQPLPGTEGAAFPFWSPDSRSIGFFAEEKLKRIEASGGPPVSLCAVSQGRGGTWNRDGVIVFGPDANGPLHQVPAEGGTSRPVTKLELEHGANTHRWPHFLPDGKHFLYLARTGFGGGRAPEGTSVRIGSLDGKVDKALMLAASNAAYASGHILFARDNTLMAQPFDAGRLELTGDAFPIAEGIQYDSSFSRGVFSVSENGVLLYQTGEMSAGTKLAWFDRKGKQLAELGERSGYLFTRISPDGSKVAVTVATGPGPDLWIFERGLRTRFTFDPSIESHPVWSPDGTRLAYRATPKGIPDLYIKPVAGAGQESPLLESSVAKYPTSWSTDGRFLAFEARGTKTMTDLWVLPFERDASGQWQPGKAFPFIEAPFREAEPHFSPDGRWMAYVSDESGRNEVYVAPFPGPGRKWQISTRGGREPRWQRGGRELYYVALNNEIMAVEVGARGDTFEIGASTALFQPLPMRAGNTYDVTGDGQRFLINLLQREQSPDPMTLVLNWPALLKDRK